MNLYSIAKWLHVLFAILAVGSNATYGIWIARASQKPDNLPFILRSIKIIDDQLANPSYGGLFLTGLSMAYLSKLPLTTPWLLSSLVLFVLLTLLGLLGYTPSLRRQILLIENQGPGSTEYQVEARRGIILGIVLAVLAVGIVFLMVVKPALWG